MTDQSAKLRQIAERVANAPIIDVARELTHEQESQMLAAFHDHADRTWGVGVSHLEEMEEAAYHFYPAYRRGFRAAANASPASAAMIPVAQVEALASALKKIPQVSGGTAYCSGYLDRQRQIARLLDALIANAQPAPPAAPVKDSREAWETLWPEFDKWRAKQGTNPGLFDAWQDGYQSGLRHRSPAALTAEKPVAKAHYGKDCPPGMVQVEFVGCSPANRCSDYGWKPEKFAFIEIYVDGQRFRVEVGDFHDGHAQRRGLFIYHGLTHGVERASANTISIFLPALNPTPPEPKEKA